jgi:hypothetical protein
MRTRPNREVQDIRQCIYSIPCKCGRCYIREIGRQLVTRKGKLMNNLEQGLMEKSKLAKHAYEEGNHIWWKEATVVQTDNMYRKYKEVAHISCITNPISQSSLEISPIWMPLICEEVGRLRDSAV